MKTLKRFLYWIIPNGGGAYLLYISFVGHIGWAWNVASFYYWATALMAFPFALLILLCGVMPDGKATLAKIAPKIERSKVAIFLDICFDIAISLALAALGHFVLAGFYLVHIFLMAFIRQWIEEAAKELAPKPEANDPGNDGSSITV